MKLIGAGPADHDGVTVGYVLVLPCVWFDLNYFIQLIKFVIDQNSIKLMKNKYWLIPFWHRAMDLVDVVDGHLIDILLEYINKYG